MKSFYFSTHSAAHVKEDAVMWSDFQGSYIETGNIVARKVADRIKFCLDNPDIEGSEVIDLAYIAGGFRDLVVTSLPKVNRILVSATFRVNDSNVHTSLNMLADEDTRKVVDQLIAEIAEVPNQSRSSGADHDGQLPTNKEPAMKTTDTLKIKKGDLVTFRTSERPLGSRRMTEAETAEWYENNTGMGEDGETRIISGWTSVPLEGVYRVTRARCAPSIGWHHRKGMVEVVAEGSDVKIYASRRDIVAFAG